MNIILICIVLILIIILYIYIIIYNKSYERYQNNSLIIIDNDMNVENSYKINSKKLIEVIDDMKKTKNINNEIIGVDNKDIVLYIDPYINTYILQNKQEPEKYKDGIFICLSAFKIRDNDCIWDFKGKVIGYIYMSDYLFIQAMIKAYRQDIKDIILKKLSPDDLKMNDKQFDYLFTYVVLDSKYMEYIKEKKYYINGLKDVDINRIKPFYPFITENYNSIKYYFHKKESDDIYNLYLNNERTLLPIMNYNILRTVENFITRLDMPYDYLKETDSKDLNGNSIGGYGCYGNGDIINKFECDSLYKIDGLPKNYYSIWDKKCNKNTECPYYKKNKFYKNERGGCIDGFCELPVGVKRIAFTKYTDKYMNSPLCYDCEDSTDLNCCSTADELEKLNEETLKSMKYDYVFENDYTDRQKNNLNTIISLLDYRGL